MAAFWPEGSDYKQYLQYPDRCIRIPRVQPGQVEKDPRGFPRHRAGANAHVYRLICNGGVHALRVFLHPSDQREQRYIAVHDHLQRVRGRAPALVGFEYHPKGICIERGFYPVLLMEWVEGQGLYDWVKQRIRARDLVALGTMAERWVALLRQLREAEVAHGDLQHGNVLVKNGELLLVDYDCMSVPALFGQPAPEKGLPAYQHPRRLTDPAGQPMSPNLDHFSAWIIWLSLRALAVQPQLYEEHVERAENDNLLFTSKDLNDPDHSPLWRKLLNPHFPDVEVSHWAEKLRASLNGSFEDIPAFELDPFSDLRAVCAVRPRRWDEIVRTAATLPAPPADLADDVDEARRRVKTREALLQAKQQGRLRPLAAAYQPALLADWLGNDPLLSEARQATVAVAALDEVEHALKSPGDESSVLKLWALHSSLLCRYAEGLALQKEIAQVPQRLQQSARLKQLCEKVPRDWRAIVALADGPVLSGRTLPADQAAILREARERCRIRSEVERALASHSVRAVQAAYKPESLDDWPECANLVRQARSARELVPVLDELARLVPGGDDWRLIELWRHNRDRLAKDVEAQRIEPMVRSCEARLESIEKVRMLLGERPRHDRQIARAGMQLQAVGAANQLTPSEQAAVEEAVHRAECLERLDKISVTLPLETQDAQWLVAWDDGLLADCADAAEARQRFLLARDRTQAWEELKEALEREELVHVADLAGRTILRNYPPLVRNAARIKALLDRGERCRKLLERIEAGDVRAFDTREDRECLRNAQKDFLAYRDRIASPRRTWSIGEIKLSPGSPPLKLEGGGKLLRVQWAWRPAQGISRCLLAMDMTRFFNIPADAARTASIQEKAFRSALGGVTIPVPSGANQVFVTIWPLLDLGWITLAGEPLHLGPVTIAAKR